MKPPEPIQLSKIALGSKGELEFHMSDSVDWPESLLQKYEYDQKPDSEKTNKTEKNDQEDRQLRIGNRQDIFTLFIEGATNMERK